MPNEDSVAAKLFPINANQRKTLTFIYHWIASKGRIPTQSECKTLGGFTCGTVANLIQKGWIVQGQYGWWPVGVTRQLKFHYPANQLLDPAKFDGEVVVRAVKESSDAEPRTLERLADIIEVCHRMHRMSHDDRETLKWALAELKVRDSIIKLQRMLLKPIVHAIETLKGKKEIPIDIRASRMNYMRLQNLLTRRDLSILDRQAEEHDATEAEADGDGRDNDGRLPVRPDAGPGGETDRQVQGGQCPDRA